MTDPSRGGHRFRWLLHEAPRPASIRDSPRAPWLIVITVCVGAFMGQLDASIVTVAIPAMRSDLHASIDEVEWVALVYLLVLVGTIAAVGRISDMFGRKLLYIYGFILFTVSSLACGLSPTIEWLLLSRAFQAVGAAMLQANSVALIRTNVPKTSLGRAIGLQGAAQAIGLALGPSVGGLLVGLAD
ncbi:MAG: MFS transporter, partial [Actinobacteria bacterium]|nr:MFS transporter [Actinomycetota bacterium]